MNNWAIKNNSFLLQMKHGFSSLQKINDLNIYCTQEHCSAYKNGYKLLWFCAKYFIHTPLYYSLHGRLIKNQHKKWNENFSFYLGATLFSLVMNLPISQWIILYGRSLENQINERVDGTCKLQSMVHKEIAPNWGTSTTCQHCINYNLCSRTNSIWYE